MEKSPSKYLETENKGMNSNIYQIILDNILSLEMKQWDKIVFYSQYDEDSYEMKFYVKQNGMYTDCFHTGKFFFFRKYISSKYMLNYTEFFMLWKGFTEKRIGY